MFSAVCFCRHPGVDIVLWQVLKIAKKLLISVKLQINSMFRAGLNTAWMTQSNNGVSIDWCYTTDVTQQPNVTPASNVASIFLAFWVGCCNRDHKLTAHHHRRCRRRQDHIGHNNKPWQTLQFRWTRTRSVTHCPITTRLKPPVLYQYSSSETPNLDTTLDSGVQCIRDRSSAMAAMISMSVIRDASCVDDVNAPAAEVEDDDE